MQEDDFAKEEKEQGILRFVEITIVRQPMRPDGSYDWHNKEQLFRYDFPREVYERRQWVITWRMARFQCQFPKCRITPIHCYYHRRANIAIWKIPLDKLVSAKRMVTKITNAMKEAKMTYIPSLYDPTIETTPHWIKAKDKLERYRLQVEYYTAEVERIKNNPTPQPLDEKMLPVGSLY
jgi:hypothetical protein